MSTLTLSPPSSVDRKSPTPPNNAEDGESDDDNYRIDRSTPVMPIPPNPRKMSPAVGHQQQQQQKSPPPGGKNNAASRIALIKSAFERTEPLKSSNNITRSARSPARSPGSQLLEAVNGSRTWSVERNNDNSNNASKNGSEFVTRIASKLQELSASSAATTPPTSADGRPALKQKPTLPPKKANGHAVVIACNPAVSRAQTTSTTTLPPAKFQVNGTTVVNGANRQSPAIKNTTADLKNGPDVAKMSPESYAIIQNSDSAKKSLLDHQSEKGRPKSQKSSLPPLTGPNAGLADVQVSHQTSRRSLPTTLDLLSNSAPELEPSSATELVNQHSSRAAPSTSININSTLRGSLSSVNDAGVTSNGSVNNAGDRSPIPELGLQEFRSHVERFHSARALFSNMEKQSTPTAANASLSNLLSPNKSPLKTLQQAPSTANVVVDDAKHLVADSADTKAFPVALPPPFSLPATVAASQVSLVKYMAQHYVEMIQQQSSPSSSSNTSTLSHSVGSGGSVSNSDQQFVAKADALSNNITMPESNEARTAVVPLAIDFEYTQLHASPVISASGDRDMPHIVPTDKKNQVQALEVVYQQHVVTSVLLGSSANTNSDGNHPADASQRQFKRRLSFEAADDEYAAGEQVDTLRRSTSRTSNQQQHVEPLNDAHVDFPVHFASDSRYATADGSHPVTSSHIADDPLNTSFSTQYSTDSLNTSNQSSPRTVGKLRMQSHEPVAASSLSSSFSADNMNVSMSSLTSRASKNLDELTLDDFADDDLALMSNEDRQQLFDRGVKTEDTFALARRNSSRRDGAKNCSNGSPFGAKAVNGAGLVNNETVVIAGDAGLTAEPYDSEMEAIDRLVDDDDDEDLNSRSHMPWDEDEDELTTTMPADGEGTLTKQARKGLSPLPPLEDEHDGNVRTPRDETFEGRAEMNYDDADREYYPDALAGNGADFNTNNDNEEPVLFNISDVIGDTVKSRFKQAFEQHSEHIQYLEDGHYYVDIPGLQPETSDDGGDDAEDDERNDVEADLDVVAPSDTTFVKCDDINSSNNELTSAGDSTFTADIQPTELAAVESSTGYARKSNNDMLDYGSGAMLGNDSGDAARLQRAVMRHRANAKVKFSCGPIRVYSTFTGDEYDRRNSAIDPVAASAEWELEKRIEKMDVFDCVMQRGEDEGLGVAIIGMGVGADIGLEKLGIFIKRVNDGGPAARLSEPGIRVGDQLIEVDGQSLVGVSQAYAAQVLRACGPLVRFRVGRDKDEQGEIAQLITAARERDQHQQRQQMPPHNSEQVMTEEREDRDDYGESEATSQVDDIDQTEMKSDDENANGRFSDAETDSLKSNDDDDDDAHAGEYDIESAEIHHERQHHQQSSSMPTSSAVVEVQSPNVEITHPAENFTDNVVLSDSLSLSSTPTTRSTSRDTPADKPAVESTPPSLPNKRVPVQLATSGASRKNASFDAAEATTPTHSSYARPPVDRGGVVFSSSNDTAAAPAVGGSTNLNKFESLSNVSVASSAINGMLNDHSEELERLQTLYEEALLRSQVAESEVDLLKDKLENVQRTQAATALATSTTSAVEEEQRLRQQADTNNRQMEQLRAAEDRARAEHVVLEDLKKQLDDKQSQLALVERKYQKAKRLMREFRHRMQSIERQYEERVKRLEAQLNEQRRNESTEMNSLSNDFQSVDAVRNYDDNAEDDDDMSVTLSTDITMSDVSAFNKATTIDTTTAGSVILKSTTTTTTISSTAAAVNDNHDIFAASAISTHDMLDATAARHRIELAYKGLLGQRQPPSRISYTASCSSVDGMASADTSNNDLINALVEASSSAPPAVVNVSSDGKRLEQEVRALLRNGSANILPPAAIAANTEDNKPTLKGVLPVEAPPLPVKSGSLIARVSRAVHQQLSPTSTAASTTTTAETYSVSSTTVTTTPATTAGAKKEYKSMHPQYRPLPQIPALNSSQHKAGSSSTTAADSTLDDAASSQVLTMSTGQTYRVTRYSALGNNTSGGSSFLDSSLNISGSTDSTGKLDSSNPSRYGNSSSPSAAVAGKSTFFYSPAVANNTPLPNAVNVSPSLSNASSLTRRIIAAADADSTSSPKNERRSLSSSSNLVHSASLLKGREMAVDVPPSIVTLPSSSLSTLRSNNAAAAAAAAAAFSGPVDVKMGDSLQEVGGQSSSSSTLTQAASLASGGTTASAMHNASTPGSSLDTRRSTVAVATWTNHHIKQMLLSLGLGHHVDAFEANNIDGNKLLEMGLDSEKLKQIGVFDRHERHLIKKKVKELRIVLVRERRAMQRTRATREQQKQQQQHALLLESLMPPMSLELPPPPASPSISTNAAENSMPHAAPLTKSASTSASSATAAIKRRLLGRGRQSRVEATAANPITAGGSSAGSTLSSTTAAAKVALNAKKKTRSASAQPVVAASSKVQRNVLRNGDGESKNVLPSEQ